MTGINLETIKGILHPGLIMMGFGIITMLLPRSWRKVLAVAGPLISLAALLMMDENACLNFQLAPYINIDLIRYDRLSFVFMLVFCIIGLLNGIYGMNIQHRYEEGMSMMYAGSVMGVILAGDCISLIIFWEISAFASTYVIYAKHDRLSARASFRYLLMHSFGGNMLLAGLIVYMFHHGNELVLLEHSFGEPCFWLIAIGVGVNAAIPPLHAWLPDAYPESTVTGTVYLSSYTTKAAIYVMIRFFEGTDSLVWIGALIAVYGACMAIMENGIRRLLAYHIISQLGMMIAAVGAGGSIGADAATAHAVTNILFKGVLMMGAGAVIYATGGRDKITELGGMARKMPVTAFCFLISSLAIAGLPGLSGFVSKALIMEAVAGTGHTVPVLLLTAAGVGTLLSITLKMNYYIFFGPCDDPSDSAVKRRVPWTMNAAMLAGTAVTIAIGVAPGAFYAILPNSAAYAAVVHPYRLGHVLEYIAIFIGGAVPFFLYIRRMKPHDEITVDFDWFYRRPINSIVLRISQWTERFFRKFGAKAGRSADYLRRHLGDPYLWTEKSRNIRIRKFSFENESRAVGDILSAIVLAFAVIIAMSAASLR